MLPLCLAVVVEPLPILCLASVLIVGMRLRGVLTDELIAELQRPFSRTTLICIGALVILWQLTWITANLSR